MSLGERVYRRLARAVLPRSLGTAAREEMVEVFLDLRRGVGRRGLGPRLAFWGRMLADLVWTGVRERLPRATAPSPHGRDPGGADRRGGRHHRPGVRAALGLAEQALRRTLRRPAHTLVVTLTIALGVGAGTLVAVLARDVLLRPLPYRDAGELLRLREQDEERRTWWPSRANFEDWRSAGAPAVAGIEAAGIPRTLPVLVGERAARARVAEASAGLFDLLGARFVRGRPPARGEASGAGPPVAVVSRSFWSAELGGGELEGLDLLIGRERFPVVGVLEPGFGFLGDGGAWERPDVWLPMERAPDEQHRTSHGIHVVARAEPDVPLARTDRDLDRMAARVADAHGEATHARSVLTTSLREDLLGPARRPVAFLLGSVVGVLLVACLNLAGTLLVDGLGRRRELSVRRALGAGRLQVAGQLLLETAAAALPAALLGLGLAWGGLELTRRLDPGALPRLDQAGMDGGTFLIAVGVAVTVAAASAVLPALLLTGRRATRQVASLGRSGHDRGVGRVWRGMIVVQVALTFTLLAGSGALTRSLLRVLRSDLGYEVDGVVSVQVALPESRYREPASRIRFFREGLEAVRAHPAVGAATVTDVLPHVTQARISGTSNPDGASEEWVWAGFRVVDPSYFQVLGIPLLQGALPAPGATGQVAVDRTVADRLLDGEILGGRVQSGMTRGAVAVTGVVGPIREWGLAMGRIGTVYADYRAVPERLLEAYLLVKGQDGRAPPVAELSGLLRDIDPQVPLAMEPLSDAMGRTLGSRRVVLAVAAGFAGLGLLFACVGIYGIVAYIARRRRREAGVRLALGARPGQIRRRALAEGAMPTCLGLIAGVGLTLLFARVARLRVEGLESLGPLSLSLTALLLGALAAAAASIPARRVARDDLVLVLREE